MGLFKKAAAAGFLSRFLNRRRSRRSYGYGRRRGLLRRFLG
ncbi:hypothetical protein [Vulgatibacter sp.]